MNKKQLYAAPATEVLELRLEASVLTESNVNARTTGENFTWGWEESGD